MATAKRGPGRRTITGEMYTALLMAFRQYPGNATRAAAAAGVDRRTARRAWEEGWPKLKLAAISSAVAAPPAPAVPAAAVQPENAATQQPAGGLLSIGEWWPIDKVKRWVRNPRRKDRSVGVVAASIRKHGFVAPMVVWRSRDQLVAGDTRYLAMQQILREKPDFVPPGAPGVGLVPVRFHEFRDEKDAAEYALIDNKANELAEWDAIGVIGISRDYSIDLTSLGFSEGEVADMSEAVELTAELGTTKKKAASTTESNRAMVSLLLSTDKASEVERAIDLMAPHAATRGEALVLIVREWMAARAG